MMGKMKSLGLLAALVLLAGCQAVPPQPAEVSQPMQPARLDEPATQTTGERQLIQPNANAADLRVFLADSQPRTGWAEVALKPTGRVYVNTQPIINRSDLIGIQSGTDQSGGGVLILVLSDTGQDKVARATAANPGLRLALVVGHTMLAAPAYAGPVRERQLAFGVGSRQNAELAARAVAGVEPLPPQGL